MIRALHDILDPKCAMGQGPMHRLDVRLKLIVSLALVAAVVLSTRPALPLAVFGLCTILTLSMGVRFHNVLHRLLAPIVLAALVCILQATMTGQTPLWIVPVGSWHVTLTAEGVASGVRIACRVLGSISAVMVLCSFSPAYEIFAALRWARLPRSWVAIATLMYRYIFTLMEQAQSVQAAQRVRMGYGQWRRSLASASDLAGIVTLRSIDQAERTHEAMIARGYRGQMLTPPLESFGAARWTVLAGCLSLVTAAYLMAERVIL